VLRTLVLGPGYIRKKIEIAGTQFRSPDDIRELQRRRLAATLRHALRHVPFYAEAGRQCGVPVEDPLAVLQTLPIIDKQTIRTRLDNFLTGPAYRRLRATSGGSTGTPFVFYQDRFVTRQTEKAFIFDQWGRVGYRFGDSIFNLRGRTPAKGRFLHHDRLFNIHFASSFDLTAQTVSDYVAAINQLRPKFLHGYPSTMYQLATLMVSAGKRLDFQPRAVFCGSEKLFPYQREKIEAVFDCRAYHWYGHSECLALGGACEYSNKLHFYPQYGYTELLPSGVTDEQGRELFEIVATGFNNPAMPLIRYRTGDYAIPAEDQNCRCGRNYLLIDEVVGRQQEFIVDANGALISATSLIFGQHYAAFAGLASIKLHQRHPGEIDVILVKGEGFRGDLLRDMQTRMRELIGDRMTMRFLFSDMTEKTAIGKARLVAQELDVQSYLGQ
jgi:phenylacetate-CoA ligase